VPEVRKPCTSDSPGTYARGRCTCPTTPRQQAGESTPPPPQEEAATQESQRPTIGRPGGGRPRLLIGLGVLGAVIVVGLIVALTYPAANKPPSEEAAVEEAVRGYFKALDAGNFAKAYSYLDLSPSAARSFGFQSQQEFINYWHLSGLTGIVINSLKVKKLSEHTAIVTVSVEQQFGDTSTPLIHDFRMEKREGQWKITG
jgi:hypothetical protein